MKPFQFLNCIECQNRLAPDAMQCPKCKTFVAWCRWCGERVNASQEGQEVVSQYVQSTKRQRFVSIHTSCVFAEQRAKELEQERLRLRLLSGLKLNNPLHCRYCKDELQRETQDWARKAIKREYDSEGDLCSRRYSNPPPCHNCGSRTPLGGEVTDSFYHCNECDLPIIPNLQAHFSKKEGRQSIPTHHKFCCK